VTKKAYKAKAISVGMMSDPYLLPDSALTKWDEDGDGQLWPNVHYIDVYNYLINSTSDFSGTALKSYKSLEAYKYFVAGWVADLRACRLSTVYGNEDNNNRLVTAKVKIFCSQS